LTRRTKRSRLSRAKGESVHLDNLLDEALKDTFPASDPIAITIEKYAGSVALSGPDGLANPSMVPRVHEVAVPSMPPPVSIFDINLWAVRQISKYYFDWWWLLLGGRS
jgi:hypothetical protein